MTDVFPWLLVGAVIVSAYPWSSWLLAQADRDDGHWLTLLLTIALSTGTLTLLMFWEGVADIRFSLWSITLPYFALMLPGLWLWLRLPSPPRNSIDSEGDPRRFRWFTAVVLTIICGASLFNAAYWPFHKDDTLGIYHRYGLLMYETEQLVPFAGRDDAFYQAYPMQIPLVYTYAYLASGWVNEYLAKTINAVLSLACLPAVFLLGRMLYGERAGWLAALLLALAPSFGKWASSGYVDLPMAFLYTLSAIFAWRLWENGKWPDALLAGAMMGLAAWTKNAALLGVMFLLLWLLFAAIRQRIRIKHIVLSLVACAVVAAPWYIRNLLEVGLIVPPTAWTDQAQRTTNSLLIFITQPENFALTGWVIIVGIMLSLIELVRGKSAPEQSLLLLLWTIPFFGFWWLLASYDPRFVLLFLPPLAVIGGRWAAHAWENLPGRWHKRLILPMAAIALILSLYVTWISVEYKVEILRNPIMSNEIKHEIVLGEG